MTPNGGGSGGGGGGFMFHKTVRSKWEQRPQKYKTSVNIGVF